MAETWSFGPSGGGTGTVNLNVIEYERPAAEIFLQEKELVQDPTIASTTPQTIIYGVGRKRKRRICTCWGSTNDVATLEGYLYAYTSQILTVGDTSTGTYLIDKMSPMTRMKGNDYVWYSIAFIEA